MDCINVRDRSEIQTIFLRNFRYFVQWEHKAVNIQSLTYISYQTHFYDDKLHALSEFETGHARIAIAAQHQTS